MTKKDPSAVVLNFGKHRGATVAEVLAKDPGYAEWIMTQGWLAERFAEVHAALASRGAASDDTPEHNAMQAKFLDHTYALACLLAATGIQKRADDWAVWRASELNADMTKQLNEVARFDQFDQEVTDPLQKERDSTWRANVAAAARAKANEAATAISRLPQSKSSLMLVARVAFEVRGVDVVVRTHGFDTWQIELKPSLGDDFPSVMRQMSRTGATILVASAYSGRGVDEPTLRKMFAANGMSLVFERDIEAELPNARAIIAEATK
jgi:uncharacterized protein CbrC (UPF0167 family)